MTGKMKRENGSVAIIVAAAFIVLICCSALVVDYGRMANNRRQLQNALDAASLAGAAALQNATDDTQAVAEAKKYAQANGVDTGTSNFNVAVDMTQKTVTVTDTRSVDYVFAQAFAAGTSGDVYAKSKAILTTALGPLKYAIFSGDTDTTKPAYFKFTGAAQNNQITGGVHSNNGITGGATVTGSVEAAPDCSIDTKITATLGKSYVSPIDMPSFTSLTSGAKVIEDQDLIDAGIDCKSGQYDLSVEQLSALLNGANVVYFHLNPSTEEIAISGSGTNIGCCVVCDGSITFNGGSGSFVSDAGFALCSLNGNVTFNGGSIQAFKGSVLAPNGKVTINGGGNDAVFQGCVYGNQVEDDGGISVDYSGNENIGLPDTHILLTD